MPPTLLSARTRPHRRVWLAWGLVLALLTASAGAAELEKVTLQLKWKHQFQFAGYYVAAEKGYYRDAGFEVQLAEAQGEDTIKAVLTGKAQYGVAGSELALRRALGEPVVALATVLQHSALALAVRGATASVHELAGKRIMLSPHDQELLAYLQREGLSGGRVQQVPQSYDIGDLIDGKVDGFSVYTTDQVFQLRKSGLRYSLVSPRAGGIDFYGDTLFATEQRARGQHERVQAFRDASLRGWQYAMDHPEETADLILAKYSRRLPREHLLFEAAEMARLMQPQLIEIGHMNPGRWRHIAAVYAEIGMLPRDFSLDGFLFDAAPAPARWLSPDRLALGGLVLAALLASGLLYRRNRALKTVLEQPQSTLAPPEPPAGPLLQDPPSGLFSRDYLLLTLPRELERAALTGTAVGLALLRVDNWAAVAQAEGRPAGHALVRALATLVAPLQPAGGFAVRWDDDLLAWVLPGATAAETQARVQRVAEQFAKQTTWSGLIEVRGTASTASASCPEDAHDAEALIARALQRLPTG
jgi:ABC-type nitrate/sulfonate/bicarbonate transport system substrate-binding protein/GGDEF domain-containing protein